LEEAICSRSRAEADASAAVGLPSAPAALVLAGVSGASHCEEDSFRE